MDWKRRHGVLAGAVAIGVLGGAGATVAMGVGQGTDTHAGSAKADGKVQSIAGIKYVTKKGPGDEGLVSEAKCPPGTHVLGGGVHTDYVAWDVNESYPTDGGDRDKVHDDGWAATLNDSAGTMHVYAICK